VCIVASRHLWFDSCNMKTMTGRTTTRKILLPTTINNQDDGDDKDSTIPIVFTIPYRILDLVSIHSPFRILDLVRSHSLSHSETLHHRRLETREVYFCLASWSVYLSDFLKVKYSLDHTEKYLVRSALTLGNLQYFSMILDWASVENGRPWSIPWVGPSFVEASIAFLHGVFLWIEII
jgi:hypothetical protein